MNCLEGGQWLGVRHPGMWAKYLMKSASSLLDALMGGVWFAALLPPPRASLLPPKRAPRTPMASCNAPQLVPTSSIGFGDELGEAAARPEEIGGGGGGTDVVGADSGAENVVVLNHLGCGIEAGLRDGSVGMCEVLSRGSYSCSALRNDATAQWDKLACGC